MDGLTQPLIIAGAGISGLTTALCFSRAGFPVHLIERAGHFVEVGAGLQLSPNASRILIALGVDRLLDSALGKPQALLVRNARSGRVLVEMPFGETALQRWGAPMWVSHRADLQNALLVLVREEKNITLSPGSQVEDIQDSRDKVSATLVHESARHRVESPLYLAAEGLWSPMRIKLEGGQGPRFSGRSAYRATVPMAGIPAPLRRNATGLWLGHRAHLVHYPLRGGQLVNIVAIVSDNQAGEEWAAPASAAEVSRRFDDFALPARELLALPESWLRWPLYTRPPLRRWPGERVVLMGDAAHPMLPFLAQGASMAIEDAAVLTRCLVEGRTVENALARFKNERTPRVARVQSEAERNGRIFHFGGPAALARDMTLAALGPTGLAAQYDWLYGFKA